MTNQEFCRERTTVFGSDDECDYVEEIVDGIILEMKILAEIATSPNLSDDLGKFYHIITGPTKDKTSDVPSE